MTGDVMSLAAGNIHASACVIGTLGVLALGGSGSGKSRAVAALLADAARDGQFARLVSDDRVVLSRVNGRCVMTAPDAIAGQLELRGSGIVSVDFMPRAVLSLVVAVELEGSTSERLPQTGEVLVAAGVQVPVMRIWPYAADSLYPTIRATFPRFLSSG